MLDDSINLVESDNFQTALDILETADPIPDLIVLDVNMLEISGINCLKTIRSHVMFDETPYGTCGFND